MMQRNTTCGKEHHIRHKSGPELEEEKERKKTTCGKEHHII
jgi:hypothetical protein